MKEYLKAYPKKVWRYRKNWMVMSIIYALIFMTAAIPPMDKVLWTFVWAFAYMNIKTVVMESSRRKRWRAARKRVSEFQQAVKQMEEEIKAHNELIQKWREENK